MNISTFDTGNTLDILGIMKTTTSFKIDADVKKKATKLAASLGLNLSTVVNHGLRKFIAEKQITFSPDTEFNAKTKRNIDRALRDIREGKNLVGPFDNIDDLKASLRK